MKTFFKLINLVFLSLIFCKSAIGSDKVKIGLIVPLSGENSTIGKSIVNATRLALNSINSNQIEILPRDTISDPETTFKVSKDLYEKNGVKIILGPVFNSNTLYLDMLPEVTFLSFSNITNLNSNNVISSGVNAISQIESIKKFLKIKNLERTIFLIPKNNYLNEIENGIKKTKIELKDKFIYDTDPTILTSQIEKLTRYPQRKQNLLDEIKRIEDSDENNAEKKIENLKKRDTLGGINFDSVIIADFDENLKSVATSLLYTDVSSKRVSYISLNQWFDDSLLKESSLQPIYFPSVKKKNYDKFIEEYKMNFSDIPNQVSFLSYDLLGLVYYLLYKNNFEVDKSIFYKKNKFKGKIGNFEINKNTITHDLSFYSVNDGKFKEIF